MHPLLAWLTNPDSQGTRETVFYPWNMKLSYGRFRWQSLSCESNYIDLTSNRFVSSTLIRRFTRLRLSFGLTDQSPPDLGSLLCDRHRALSRSIKWRGVQTDCTSSSSTSAPDAASQLTVPSVLVKRRDRDLGLTEPPPNAPGKKVAVGGTEVEQPYVPAADLPRFSPFNL